MSRLICLLFGHKPGPKELVDVEFWVGGTGHHVQTMVPICRRCDLPLMREEPWQP